MLRRGSRALKVFRATRASHELQQSLRGCKGALVKGYRCAGYEGCPILHSWVGSLKRGVCPSFQRQELITQDGAVHALDWVTNDVLSADSPCVFCAHGLGGDSSSQYVTVLAQICRRNDWRLAVHVRRGHGGLPLAQAHAFPTHGAVEDTNQAVTAFHAAFPLSVKLMVGVSIGANIAALHLGTQGDKTVFAAMVGLSNGFDFDVGTQVMTPTGNAIMLSFMGEIAPERTLHLPRSAAKPRHLRCLDAWIHKRCVHRYYAENSCVWHLDNIRAPTLFLSALDDPVVPASLSSIGIAAAVRSPHIAMVTTEHGGHPAPSPPAAANPSVVAANLQLQHTLKVERLREASRLDMERDERAAKEARERDERAAKEAREAREHEAKMLQARLDAQREKHQLMRDVETKRIDAYERVMNQRFELHSQANNRPRKMTVYDDLLNSDEFAVYGSVALPAVQKQHFGTRLFNSIKKVVPSEESVWSAVDARTVSQGIQIEDVTEQMELVSLCSAVEMVESIADVIHVPHNVMQATREHKQTMLGLPDVPLSSVPLPTDDRLPEELCVKQQQQSDDEVETCSSAEEASTDAVVDPPRPLSLEWYGNQSTTLDELLTTVQDMWRAADHRTKAEVYKEVSDLVVRLWLIQARVRQQGVYVPDAVVREGSEATVTVNRLKRFALPNRDDVWAAWHGVNLTGPCFCCEARINVRIYERGHIVSEHRGGTNRLSNICTICTDCNKAMGTMDAIEYRARLLKMRARCGADPIEEVGSQ
ncbi:hypothetical protein HXX76_014121 [Chlamydomonas incerta]|uniref:Serine aminopeptidase S33 domain-containing protein n=1 Tax=Chlamydomonas incerta TaxID=51695 RepID=A0A835VT72_CHLIN|nr:hypothetical protein HXX76_014121 [Chlamydomonas incerta]|eukprot:KAG2424963.1 hypothetical protein HXX76_014121 [Chlamydomonas incerta]